MIKFIAHRGNNNNSLVPNSFEAIMSSLSEDYIAGVEMDVRLTLDNKIVVFHNFFIDNQKLPLKIVSLLTLKEIRKYNIGTIKKPLYVETLNNILKNIKTKKILIIELKAETNNYKIGDLVIKIIKKYKKLNIYLCSFNYNLVKYLQKKYPTYKVGVIISSLINTRYINNKFDFTLITLMHIDKISKDKCLVIFTINSTSELSKIMAFKKDFFVITDEPLKLSNYYNHHLLH